MTELRDYQQEMLERIHRAWKNQRSVMVQMPTGTGKTHLMAAVIRERLADGVLVVAHRRELIEQIQQTLQTFGLSMDNEGGVHVQSIQWLAKHLEEVQMKPGLIVVDEAHHALARTYRMLWEKWPEAKFLGLTATPCRLNGAPFTDLFDILLQSWDIRRFIAKGWLSDFEYVSARPDSVAARKIGMLRKRGADGDYQVREMAAVIDCEESVEHLYRTYRTFANGRKGIVYAINREHARHIADYYTSHGVNCGMIDSGTPDKERAGMVEDYRSGRLQVLVNVDIFSEGFDCPEVEFIQLARPTLSLSKYLQQVGRGMRVSSGKKQVLILDQVGMYLTFGLPTDDRNWREMFVGNASGKGQQGISRCVIGEENELEKELVNLEMVRIKSGGERRSGLEVFLQDGRYGVMRNGTVTCPAVFREVQRLDHTSRFFALGIYPKTQARHGMTTVIDRRGIDLKVRLFGEVVQDGDFFRVFDGPYMMSWDSVGGRYYEFGFPKIEKVGGIEVVFTDQKGYRLRQNTGLVSPSFEKDEILYNKDIAIIRDSLIVKADHNHAYRIYGYLGDSVLVQSEGTYGFQQIYADGKMGEYYTHAPSGMTRVVDFKRLGLKRASS